MNGSIAVRDAPSPECLARCSAADDACFLVAERGGTVAAGSRLMSELHARLDRR